MIEVGKLSRRAFVGFASVTSVVFRRFNRTDAQLNEVEHTKLIELRHIPDGYSSVCTRLLLHSGQSWNAPYLGPFSAMVQSGVMTVPKLGTRGIGIVSMPYLECGDMPRPNGQELTCGWGVYAESGEYGSIENHHLDDLVVLVMSVSPPETVH